METKKQQSAAKKKKAARRPSLPKSIETQVLIESHRRCCLCFYFLGRSETDFQGQIAHIDRDPNNNREGNLAYLCLQHHDAYDSSTSQSKGLVPAELRMAKSELKRHLERIPDERDKSQMTIEIPGDFSTFTDADQQAILRAIAEAAAIVGEIRVIGRKRSSIIIFVELAAKDAAKLYRSFNQGQLNSIGVSNIEPDDPSDGKTRARTLQDLGIDKANSGDHRGAVSEFTQVLEMEDALPLEKAQALINRGVSRTELGEHTSAIEDYSSVIESQDSTNEQKAKAFYNRGLCRAQKDDHKGAIRDYTAAISIKVLGSEYVAKALVNRGVSKGETRDYAGELNDYTSAIEMTNVSQEQKARALFNRAVSKGEQGDSEGEILDYRAVTKMDDVSYEQKATAQKNLQICENKSSTKRQYIGRQMH